MYSLVMLAAMTAGPDVPQAWLCTVTPSNYGSTFWSKHCFYDCCAPARYGWVDCYSKGFGAYPGGSRGFCGSCATSYGQFYHPSACGCAPCGGGYSARSCGKSSCGFCGYGWGICQPAYYTSVLGCPPQVCAPPYANYTERNPCCTHGHFAFDSGLIGHSSGVGYSGFGGYGNFGFYGGVPMMHPPTTANLPPFPHPEYRSPAVIPTGPAPMPPLPGVGTPSAIPPESLLPKPPAAPIPDAPKKDDKKKPMTARPTAATVVLSVPVGSTVTVEGHALSGTAGERTFRTPTLEPGREYEYTVRAVIEIDGRQEVETRQVTVVAGEISRASFEALFAKVDTNKRSIVDAKPRR
jgi:uncharacterized protein (TIGR03000 family)